MIEVGWDDLASLCTRAVLAAGGDDPTATELTRAVLASERRGSSAVGVAHLFDYLDALEAGRLNGAPHPSVRHDLSSVVTVDADDGIAQLAFARASPALAGAARSGGAAVLSVSNAYSAGALSHYTGQLAADGLIALAVASSPALMSLFDAPVALTGTNPISFALPGRPAPRVVDQASSAVAWVKIRDAAAAGRSIPLGWALDADGAPTTDAAAALLGPVLPFGGVKGSNLAVVVELLAVLSGSLFPLDAPPLDAGEQPPRNGLFLLALDPGAFDAGYLDRVETHLTRLAERSGVDFGRHSPPVTRLALPEPVHARLVEAAVGR